MYRISNVMRACVGAAQRTMQASPLPAAQPASVVHNIVAGPLAAYRPTVVEVRAGFASSAHAGHLQQHLPLLHQHYVQQQLQQQNQQHLPLRTYATSTNSSDPTSDGQTHQQRPAHASRSAPAAAADSPSSHKQEVDTEALAAADTAGDTDENTDADTDEDGDDMPAHLSIDPRVAAAWDAHLTPDQRTVLQWRLAAQQAMSFGSSLNLVDGQGNPREDGDVIPLYLRAALTPSAEAAAAIVAEQQGGKPSVEAAAASSKGEEEEEEEEGEGEK